MSSLSIMEWNAKHPLPWDWETAVASSPKATDNLKIWQPAQWGIEADEGLNAGSLYSYKGVCASGCSSGGTSFDHGYTSMSKSPKSVSMNSSSTLMHSSSTEDMRFPIFSIETCKGYPEDLSYKRDRATTEISGSSPTFESSVCSDEPLLSLKLGKRSYLEDTSDGNNPKASHFHTTAKASDASSKKIRPNNQNMPAPCCQVEGCNIDLSHAKDYHKKHRVCESHSKTPRVVVNGIERRFCQQCSRFHGLSEFDENKRSCRKRLSDHNARRRKPHSDVAHFNQARLSSSIYGDPRQVNSIYSGPPYEHSKSSLKFAWPNTSSTIKFMQTKEDAATTLKAAAAADEGNQHYINKLPDYIRSVTAISDGSYEPLPLKGATVKILSGGSEASLISSGGLDAPQDLHRALSLLSTDSRDSCRQAKPAHRDMHNTSISYLKPWTCAVPESLSLPLGSTDYWNMEQWMGNTHDQMQTMTPPSVGRFGSSSYPERLLPTDGQHEFGFGHVHLN